MRTFGAVVLLLILAAGTGAQEAYHDDAEKHLKMALGKRDLKLSAEEVGNVAMINDRAAAQILLKFAIRPPIKTDDWNEYYWMLLRGIGCMTSEDATMATADLILALKKKPIGRDLLGTLAQFGHDNIIPAMGRILEKGPEDMQLLAANHLVALGDPRAVPLLITGLRKAKKKKRLVETLADGLFLLTRQDLGGSVPAWEVWWKENQTKEFRAQGRPNPKTGTIADRLDRSRWKAFENLKKAKLLVVEAGQDHCGLSDDHDDLGKLLNQMGLNVDTVKKSDLGTASHAPLKDYAAVVVNCMKIHKHCDVRKCGDCSPKGEQCRCARNNHPSSVYRMSSRARKTIKKYVDGGGRLFTQDRALEELLVPLYSKRLAVDRPMTAGEIRLLPQAGAADHPYLRRVFYQYPKKKEGDESTTNRVPPDYHKINHQWMMDEHTRGVRILSSRKVDVLLTTSDGRTPLAFTMEQGRVLHITTHFGKQKVEWQEWSVQNVLVNFLMESVAGNR